MKAQLVLTSLLAAAIGATPALAADVAGGSSDPDNVETGGSTLFGSGDAGLKLAGSSAYIDLAGGPIAQSNNAISRGADGLGNYYLKGEDINFLAGLIMGDTKIAQVWKSDVAYNGSTTRINSVRQMIVPPSAVSSFMPNFGGLVIGQVDGSSVYFGEWSPKGSGYAAEDSTDLNMSSSERTVWYVGDDAVDSDSMPTAIDATYSVVGIQQTGVGSNLPGSPDVYTGTLAASYASGSGSLSGSIDRGTDTVDFTGTDILDNGTFTRASGSSQDIEGRFYNGAEALAGIYTGSSGAADDVAFGGSKTGGTITP
ncbi:Slam-dependent surface lipoprotein [Billgrantia gudaonensis]|uniref:Transferrin-binding protein B C-lobe/N-lobe beta barrel domain-containing protein n=1 Tax=Billgrantia gudaonensis TaxID=376427 RepID=A0A1G8N062_9GAMM|nr:Slam-dependent surface lipoprotein [Halomonas gudaonensis]SDI73592.1 hypothetical protein SAMN04487954_101183 [Halomonas gudaonensis]